MKTRLLLFPLLLAGGILPAQSAETETTPPPTEPFLARVPLPAAWTITFTRPAADEVVDMAALISFVESSMGPDSEAAQRLAALEAPLAKPMVRELSVVRTTDFAKESVKFSDETTQTSYVFNIARITKHIAYDGLIRSRTDSSVKSYSPDFAQADFAGFDWLSKDNFKGEEIVEERPCYVFESEQETPESQALRAMSPGQGEAEKVTMRAFIDASTRLPVMLQIGEETRLYTVGNPTAADLALPPDVSAEISAWRAQLISATTAAPPP